MSQNHFTLSFPLKSPSDAKLLAEQLPPMMPELFRANDTIGTVHYSRFTVLGEKTLLFLGAFDGELVSSWPISPSTPGRFSMRFSYTWMIHRRYLSPAMSMRSSSGRPRSLSTL
jgi:hypothetical protein